MNLPWFLMFIALSISGFPINSILPINLNISDVIYLIILIFIVGEKFKSEKYFGFHLRKYNLFLILGVYVLSMGAILSLFRSYEPVNSVFTLLQYLFVFSILTMVVHYIIRNDLKNIDKLLFLFIIPSLITMMLVVISKIGIFNSFDNYIVTGNGRYQGFSGNPNGFGSEIVLALVILYYFIMAQNKRYLWVFIPFAYYCIILTASFGALLQLIVLHILMLLFTNIKFKIISFFLGTLSILFLFSERLKMYIPRPIQERFLKTNGEVGSYDLRMELNFLGLKEFFNNPIVGVGFEQFKYYNPYGNVVHNTIISTLVETGILGLFGLMIILLFPLIRGLVLYYNSPDPLLKYLLIFILIKLTSTLVSGHFISREPWIPVLALMIYLSIKNKNNKKVEEVNEIEEANDRYRQSGLQRQ